MDFLNFEENKVQPITLDTLEKTYKENDVYGNPLKGVYHFELINNIIGRLREHNLSVSVYDMFASNNKDRQSPGVVVLPQIEERYGKNATEAHILRRVYTNLAISNFDNDEMTMHLAVTFHQKGIQAGFGPMVKICHNGCILGAQDYISTYSDRGKKNGVSLTDIYDRVESWAANAEDIFNERINKINRMKSIIVENNEVLRIIGRLTAMRVSVDSKDPAIHLNETYPLNQSQISKFTEMILIKSAERAISLWDIYNTATELYKAESMDIPMILPQNRAMDEFLLEYQQ